MSDTMDLERQLARLASLLATAQRLGEARSRDEVLAVVAETLANVVGTEEFGVFQVAPDGSALAPLYSLGLDPERERRLADGATLRQVVRSGEPFMPTAARADEPVKACFPLRASGRVVGAVAIVALLPQKLGLEPFDRDVFGVLATHAGRALSCTAELEAGRPLA